MQLTIDEGVNMMPKDKIIPIKHGGPYDNVEAHANLDTGEVEHSSWEEGPSNIFNHSQTRVVSLPATRDYTDNYKRIFGHD